MAPSPSIHQSIHPSAHSSVDLSVQDNQQIVVTLMPDMCLNISGSVTFWRRIVSLINRRKLVIQKDKQPTTTFFVKHEQQRRHDSCIKVICLRIVRQPCTVTTECKQKPEAFVQWWVWPSARCLVNRRQTLRPEAKNCSAPLWIPHGQQRWAPSGLDGLKMFVRAFILVLLFRRMLFRVFLTRRHALTRPGSRCWYLCKHGRKAVTCWSCFWTDFIGTVSWTGAIVEANQCYVLSFFG